MKQTAWITCGGPSGEIIVDELTVQVIPQADDEFACYLGPGSHQMTGWRTTRCGSSNG